MSASDLPRGGAAKGIGKRWSALVAGVRARITWNRIYRATSYLRSALWVVPLFAIVAVVVLAPLLRVLDQKLRWDLTGLTVSGAQALCSTVITLNLSFLVFTFGSLLVAIQVAGGQLTPRIIATTLLRNNVVRYSVGLFTFTLIFAVTSLNRLERSVPGIVVLVVDLMGLASMVTFLFLIDYAARLLRPVSIVSRVGEEGLRVIETMYPDPVSGPDEPPPREDLGKPARIMTHEAFSGILLAVDLVSLARKARRHGGTIEVLPQVGDFVANGEPLLRLYGGSAAICDQELAAVAAFGPERTLEQDPIFAFRILVDIALKALSPAINDPTTAVLAIDQVHRLLRVVGRRQLRGDAIRDSGGTVRVIFRTPNWEDFVHVACREIRACGASSMQVARRMRAMLDDVLELLPPERHAALQEELRLLDVALESRYPLAEDLALARTADVQGLGGSARRTP